MEFEKSEKAARDLAPVKALGMLQQQVKEGVHSGYTHQQSIFPMSRPLPYQPMGPRPAPAGDADVARMMEKLAARAHAAPQSEVKKEPLQWQIPVKTGAHGSGYMLSVCGGFSVVKTMHELGFTYCAFDIRTKNADGGMATCLGCKRLKEEAIVLCEAAR